VHALPSNESKRPERSLQSIKRKFGLGPTSGSQRDLTSTPQRPLSPGTAVHLAVKDKRPHGHYTAWPLRDGPLGPPEIPSRGAYASKSNSNSNQHLRAPLLQSLFMRSPWGSADAGVKDASEPRTVRQMSAKSANLLIKSFLGGSLKLRLESMRPLPATGLPNLSLAARRRLANSPTSAVHARFFWIHFFFAS
jgi:hypothetical protein